MRKHYFEPNTVTRHSLEVPNTGISIPATVVSGKAPGPVITVSAGVHSREYIGIEALIRLSKQLRPEVIAGTVVLLHCCNYGGFIRRSSDCFPADGKNLNREFPGSPDGTVTQQVAAYLEASVINGSDYIVDLHSGGFCEALIPHVYYQGTAAPEVCAESFRLAKLASPEYLVRSSAQNGFYSHAGQCGVPAIIIERGGCGQLHEAEVRQDIADVKNILRGLGALKDAASVEHAHIQIPFGFYLDAPCSGCWYPRKNPGEAIECGEILGEIRSIYGEVSAVITAQSDGVILYQTASLGIEKDRPMVAYGVIESFLKES